MISWLVSYCLLSYYTANTQSQNTLKSQNPLKSQKPIDEQFSPRTIQPSKQSSFLSPNPVLDVSPVDPHYRLDRVLTFSTDELAICDNCDVYSECLISCPPLFHISEITLASFGTPQGTVYVLMHEYVLI